MKRPIWSLVQTRSDILICARLHIRRIIESKDGGGDFNKKTIGRCCHILGVVWKRVLPVRQRAHTVLHPDAQHLIKSLCAEEMEAEQTKYFHQGDPSPECRFKSGLNEYKIAGSSPARSIE